MSVTKHRTTYGRRIAVVTGAAILAIAMAAGTWSGGGMAVRSAQAVDAPYTAKPSAQLCRQENDDAVDEGLATQSGSGVNAPAGSRRCTVAGVHADAMSVFVDHNGRLTLKSKADNVFPDAGDGVRYDTNALSYRLPDNAKQSSADMPDTYDFLKKATGNGDFWYIPQTQDPSVLWAGFSTEALNGNAHISKADKVTMHLESFRGPGRLFMWSNDSFGGIIRQLGSDGLDKDSAGDGWPTEHTLNIPQHEHMNWAFTAPGRYTYTMSATVNVDGKPQTDEQEYMFIVGDAQPEPAATEVALAAASAQTGRPIDLIATVTSDQFQYPQGWVQYASAATGQTLGYAKLIDGKATLTVPGFPIAGVQRITASYIPRFAEDAWRSSTEGTVAVTGDDMPETLSAPTSATADAGKVASVDAIGPDQATARVTLAADVTDTTGAAGAVYGDVMVEVADARDGDVPQYQRALSSAWYRLGQDSSITVPLPAMPGTYRLLLRDGNDTQIGSAELKVPTVTGAEPYRPSIPSTETPGPTGGNNTGGGQQNTGQGGSVVQGGGRNAGAQNPQSGACTSKDMIVLDQGHIDIAAFSPTDDSLQMVIQEDATGNHVRREPGGVMLWLKPESHNGSVWSVPQTQKQGLIWLGWNNQFLADRRQAVTWTINSVDGPGTVRVWTQGNLGQAGTTIWSSDGERTFHMPANTHTHANWDFSAEGYYKINMTYDSALGSDTETVYITVGNADPKAMPLECAVLEAAKTAGGGVVSAKPATRSGAEKNGENDTSKQSKQSAKRGGASADGSALSADGTVAAGLPGMFELHPILTATMFFVVGAVIAGTGVAAPFILRWRR